MFYCNHEGMSQLEVVSAIKESVNRYYDLVKAPESFLRLRMCLLRNDESVSAAV